MLDDFRLWFIVNSILVCFTKPTHKWWFLLISVYILYYSYSIAAWCMCGHIYAEEVYLLARNCFTKRSGSLMFVSIILAIVGPFQLVFILHAVLKYRTMEIVRGRKSSWIWKHSWIFSSTFTLARIFIYEIT